MSNGRSIQVIYGPVTGSITGVTEDIDSVLMDFRTIQPEEDSIVVKALMDIFDAEDHL